MAISLTRSVFSSTQPIHAARGGLPHQCAPPWQNEKLTGRDFSHDNHKPASDTK